MKLHEGGHDTSESQQRNALLTVKELHSKWGDAILRMEDVNKGGEAKGAS